MSNNNLIHIELDGDPELQTSFGEFSIYADRDTGVVSLDIPDRRYGHTTLYDFSAADWARIKELINSVF
ncbi:hypothetical protein [Mycolicibacterium diernhoferi]|uniref:Uncharacterized protein n=1 Tax=Mycolicibacterium diernhoferi TaxID=1801 RepID=A0A1Q4HL47_9MYCO|nr:hypothetical protein [Mycolicibacterium diernhoferi]OJZ68172.1 hypothetical protein BRW64_00830 [Mycolicibacterium diernhoferi]OPE55762.1 hypothetical protein BV510_03455 [Mycolicibacterium diernhoferi]PEG56267.1 hypothetical protein CRI78_02560 [Mycolicibacterium diernhoferi]QYL21340.1 hypothetical protein K0O62_20250 [Mycolicibacterium diernhoferi]